MTSSNSVIRADVIAAVRTSAVASAAGISSGVWSSSTTPRVFSGEAGYIGGRNRGRLPFVEVAFAGQTFDNLVDTGGTMTTSVRIIAHGTGRDPQTAEELLHGILATSLAEIRDLGGDHYQRMGTDLIEAIQPGPFGWQMEAKMEIEHSYDGTNYEVG